MEFPASEIVSLTLGFFFGAPQSLETYNLKNIKKIGSIKITT